MKTLVVIVLISLMSMPAAFAQQGKKASKRVASIEKVQINSDAVGYTFMFDFTHGKRHNRPSFAIWIEDMQGNYMQELFVTRSFGRGEFRYGAESDGKWVPGERRYQSVLPYYIHKRALALELADMVPSPKNPVADAYTGATPKASFSLNTKSENKLMRQFRVLIEINQAWDVNDFWYSGKFPDDPDYRASCQPSLVYAVEVNTDALMDVYYFNPIGHGHYSGKDGRLYTDLSGFTTALQIFQQIKMQVINQ